jgi:hypothetical protein
MKWNIVWAEFSLEMGGRTPRASQVRRIILLGWFVDKHGILAFWMYSMGYALWQVSKGRRSCRILNIPSSVFRKSCVIVVNETCLGIENNVLED